MSISKMQHKVKEFVDSYNLQTDLATRLLDLVSEVGELSKEVLKATSYGKKDIELTENFSSELGDVFLHYYA
ncbi:MazG-like family protein [Clostridium sp. 'deep sea']|uniref:MazG-like family protein n=1 Tax=Clostridium sp. 'deep sea' TaxID=2779445 RepID=UPI0018967751|nr:MazG-like family protein [Clostridium sp. 'deep sea']QOR34653.1 MazG-like family protein [Clostridium sp. 'deep sea']